MSAWIVVKIYLRRPRPHETQKNCRWNSAKASKSSSVGGVTQFLLVSFFLPVLCSSGVKSPRFRVHTATGCWLSWSSSRPRASARAIEEPERMSFHSARLITTSRNYITTWCTRFRFPSPPPPPPAIDTVWPRVHCLTSDHHQTRLARMESVPD